MIASQSLHRLSWFTTQKHNVCVSMWSVSSPQSKQGWVNPCDTVIPVIFTSFVNKGANLGCVFCHRPDTTVITVNCPWTEYAIVWKDIC